MTIQTQIQIYLLTWVNLPIASNTIWIYQILETSCKFIGAIECRWGFCSFNHIQKWRNWTATSRLERRCFKFI